MLRNYLSDWASSFRAEKEKQKETAEAIALNQLGVQYATGNGKEKDAHRAVDCYRQAAEKGLAAAQLNLGGMYLRGEGVEKNIREARVWWARAAEQGNPVAQYLMGWSSHMGEGTERDFAQAIEWYHRAAEQGFTFARNNLAAMYVRGEGVPQDGSTAYMWAILAMEIGGKRQIQLREEIEQTLTHSQIEEGRRLAEEWKKQHPLGPPPLPPEALFSPENTGHTR